jgi:hypothetical protein
MTTVQAIMPIAPMVMSKNTAAARQAMKQMALDMWNMSFPFF